MSASVGNIPDSRLTVMRSPVRTRRPLAPSARLANLRKIRECEQAAAICYRVRNGVVEFLLIQTRGSGRWTFPKGSAEPGLTHAQAAALEAFEEAGVHGRIEEASFARYVRRRSTQARRSSPSAAKSPAVSAHLCEVLRLCSPKEPKRNRTWFSVQETKRRLRDGREECDGAEFARVVDLATTRIRRLRGAAGLIIGRPQKGRPQPDRLRRGAPQEDALQKVQFEALTQPDARLQEVSRIPYIRRRRLADTREYTVPAGDDHFREPLQCEVLQFGLPQPSHPSSTLLPRAKRVKALGTGAKNG